MTHLRFRNGIFVQREMVITYTPGHDWEKEVTKGSFAMKTSFLVPAFGQRRETLENLHLQEPCQLLSPALPPRGLVIGPCNHNAATL